MYVVLTKLMTFQELKQPQAPTIPYRQEIKWIWFAVCKKGMLLCIFSSWLTKGSMIGYDKENTMPHHPETLDTELSSVTGWDFRLPPWGRGDCAEWLKGINEYLVIIRSNCGGDIYCSLNIYVLSPFPSCFSIKWNYINSSGSKCQLCYFWVKEFKN